MLLHGRKWQKNIKKWWKKYLLWEAHKRLTKKNKEKSWLTTSCWLLIWNFDSRNKFFQRTFCVMRNKVFQRISSCAWEVHVEKRTKNNKFPNEQPAFGCQPAIESHSQSLTNKLFSSVFFVFLREPLMSLSCAWWKRYCFTHFRVFSINFDHANACASMCSLVEIHNKCIYEKTSFKISAKSGLMAMMVNFDSFRQPSDKPKRLMLRILDLWDSLAHLAGCEW